MARRSFFKVLASLLVAGYASCVSASDFIAPRFFSVPGSGVAVTTADFNGDGKMDLAVLNVHCCDKFTHYVSILLGNGDRTFQAPVNYNVSGGPNSIAVADFNQDGHPDLAVGWGAPTGFVDILINKGDGTFRFAGTNQLCADGGICWGIAIAAGDFNGDHNQDLAVANGPTGIDILLGNGDGTFQPFVNLPVGMCPVGIAAGDLNHDGKLDLAIADGQGCFNQQPQEFVVLLGKGNGSFRPPVSYPAGDSPAGIVLGDFNRDGNVDVAVANLSGILIDNPDTNTVDVFLGDGDGSFGPRTMYKTDYGPARLIAADLNGDGNLDLVANSAVDSDVNVLFGDGSGSFQPALRYEAGLFPVGLAFGDFTGGGSIDLVTANDIGDNVTLISNGPPRGSLQSALNYKAGPSPVAVATADFNGDGKPDLVVANDGYGTQRPWAQVNVLLGRGDGRFKPRRVTKARDRGPDAIGIAVGDFNGDGKADVALNQIRNEGRAVTILLGKGDGTFLVQKNYLLPTGNSSAPLIAADLNGDGVLDLVAAGCYPGICILLGKGNGEFRPAREYDTGGDQFAAAIAVGDFNKDGIPDVAAVNVEDVFTSYSVGILFGKGDGTFGPAEIFSAPEGPVALLAADFNGDGNLDLVLLNQPADTVSVLLGKGNGTFATAKDFPAGGFPMALAAADFNRDGKLDLAVSDNGDPGTMDYVVSVLHGNGDGTFAVPEIYPVGLTPASIAAGDFTGSGGWDLAVLDTGNSGFDPKASNLTVYLSRRSK